MLDKKISSLAVGSNGNVNGIFTKTDLTRYCAENFVGKKNVSNHMTPHTLGCSLMIYFMT